MIGIRTQKGARMGSGTATRNLANVANLSTPLGIVVGLAARGRFSRRGGLIIVERARLPFVSASAMTIGSVVLVPDRALDDVVARIPALLEHESEHAWQYAYCLGLPFIPLYALSTVWSLLRTGDRASANHFEVQAGLETGGYRPASRRPVGQTLGQLANGARKLIASRFSPAGGERNVRPGGSRADDAGA